MMSAMSCHSSKHSMDTAESTYSSPVPTISSPMSEADDICGSEIERVETLEGDGITSDDIQRLREAGFHSVKSVAYAGRKLLTDVKGLSEAKVAKLLATAKTEPTGFQTASVYHNRRSELIKLTTGSNELDRILGGGIESGSITEIFGEFRTGKSQLCHTLAVTAQLPVERGGGNGKVIFIDTEGTFRTERIIAIGKRFNLTETQVLDNISHARAHNSETQLQLLKLAGALMMESKYALVIVDSSMNLLRTDYPGRAELALRQQKLAQFLITLQRITDAFNVPAVITNQVYANVDGFAFTDSTRPTGGHTMAHLCQTRLYLRKARGENRICKVYSSPSLPEVEARFSIQNDGIRDEAEF